MLTSVKNNKKQQNKNGVVLVTVLFVFIIAAIFITCAIMMTSGTRERIYDKAEQSQARLTVTSAAEAFYQAVVNQRIPDADLESMCGSPVERKIVAPGIPGLSNDDDNCTTYKCYKGAGNLIIVEFTTKIGTATDSVKITLQRTPPTPGQPAFTQMVETSSDMNPAEMVIGAGGAGRSDNTVLIRGNAEIKGGESSTNPISNYIILGTFTPRAGFTFQGDLVFWGENATLDMTNASGGGLRANNVFFINPTNTFRPGTSAIIPAGNEPCYVNNWGFINTGAAFNDKTRSDVLNNASVAPTSITFANASFDADHYATTGISNPVPTGENAAQTWLTGNTNYLNTQDATTITNLAQIIEDSVVDSFGDAGMTLQGGSIGDRMDNYISNSLVEQINKDYPTASEAEGSIFGLGTYTLGSATPLSVATLQACLAGTAPTGHVLPNINGAYVINAGSMLTISTNNGTTDYIEIDLTDPGAQQCVIFINGSVEFRFVRFLVRTDNPQDWFKIVLTSGSNCTFIGNGGQGRAGIYSATGRDYADVDNNGGVIGASAASNPKPHAYIFGYGSNTVTLGGYSVVEAYIGLYGGENDDSKVTTDDFTASNAYYLGRIMASTVTHHNGSPLNIPYCVDPNTNDGEDGLVIINSQYRVIGFEYFTPAP